MTEARTVSVSRDFAHPPEKLWRALTQPHLIAEWLMKTDFAPVPGHRFTLTGDWGGVLDCQVLTVDPPHALSYSWNFAHPDPAFDLRSVVTFTLTPTAQGTRLQMDQTGFLPAQVQARKGATGGWHGHFDRLELVLAQPQAGDVA